MHPLREARQLASISSQSLALYSGSSVFSSKRLGIGNSLALSKQIKAMKVPLNPNPSSTQACGNIRAIRIISVMLGWGNDFRADYHDLITHQSLGPRPFRARYGTAQNLPRLYGAHERICSASAEEAHLSLIRSLTASALY